MKTIRVPYVREMFRIVFDQGVTGSYEDNMKQYKNGAEEIFLLIVSHVPSGMYDILCDMMSGYKKSPITRPEDFVKAFWKNRKDV